MEEAIYTKLLTPSLYDAALAREASARPFSTKLVLRMRRHYSVADSSTDIDLDRVGCLAVHRERRLYLSSSHQTSWHEHVELIKAHETALRSRILYFRTRPSKTDLHRRQITSEADARPIQEQYYQFTFRAEINRARDELRPVGLENRLEAL